MNSKELAFEIAQQHIQMEAEITAFREVLRRYWKYPDSPWEPLVAKGKDQLLNHETTHQRYAELQSAFDAASDDGHLVQVLHDQMLRRMKVSE